MLSLDWQSPLASANYPV